MTIYHRHHIIPKHMGGTDDPSNLVMVTVEQHANLHKQLWEDLKQEEDKIAWLALSGQISLDEASIRAWKLGCKKGGLTMKGRKLTEDHRKKITESRIGEKNPMFGKKWSDNKTKDMKKRMRGKNNPFYGKKHTNEMKKTLSEKRKQRHLNGSKEGRKEGHHYPHSKETKKKLSAANKAQFNDPLKRERHRQAMIEWAIRRKNKENNIL